MTQQPGPTVVEGLARSTQRSARRAGPRSAGRAARRRASAPRGSLRPRAAPRVVGLADPSRDADAAIRPSAHRCARSKCRERARRPPALRHGRRRCSRQRASPKHALVMPTGPCARRSRTSGPRRRCRRPSRTRARAPASARAPRAPLRRRSRRLPASCRAARRASSAIPRYQATRHSHGSVGLDRVEHDPRPRPSSPISISARPAAGSTSTRALGRARRSCAISCAGSIAVDRRQVARRAGSSRGHLRARQQPPVGRSMPARSASREQRARARDGRPFRRPPRSRAARRELVGHLLGASGTGRPGSGAVALEQAAGRASRSASNSATRPGRREREPERALVAAEVDAQDRQRASDGEQVRGESTGPPSAISGAW